MLVTLVEMEAIVLAPSLGHAARHALRTPTFAHVGAARRVKPESNTPLVPLHKAPPRCDAARSWEEAFYVEANCGAGAV